MRFPLILNQLPRIIFHLIWPIQLILTQVGINGKKKEKKRKAEGRSPIPYSLTCCPNPAKQARSFPRHWVTVSRFLETKWAQTHWDEQLPEIIKRKLVTNRRGTPKWLCSVFSFARREIFTKTHKWNSDKEAVTSQAPGLAPLYLPPWGHSSWLVPRRTLFGALIMDERWRIYAPHVWSCHSRKKSIVQMVMVMVTAQTSHVVNLCMVFWAPLICFLNMIITNKGSLPVWKSMEVRFMATGEIFKYFQESLSSSKDICSCC